jgi:hypothetical protein
MNLSVDQHHELTRISRYFEKIEEMADRMGLEVDCFAEGLIPHNSSVFLNLKHNLQDMAAKRQHIFRNYHHGGKREHASIVNLTVIVNEGRF